MLDDNTMLLIVIIVFEVVVAATTHRMLREIQDSQKNSTAPVGQTPIHVVVPYNS